MTLNKSVLASVAAVALTVTASFAMVPASTNTCNYQFSTNLRMGAVSSDVMNLQKVLNMDAATRVAATGAGSMGSETMRFGPATMAAVKKFQAANGITPVSGYVGPLTRASLNMVCTGTTNTNTSTNTTTNNSGVVSNNIPVSVLVQGQAGAKLGEFVVSGNGMVTNITLQRIGLSNNATLANVYLYDGNTRITDGASPRTDGSISFNSTSGMFSVNGSKTITVRADIASSGTSGQTVGVALTGVTMMGGTATPVMGVNGPLFSISSATTATANFQVAANTTVNPSSTTVNPGSMNQTLWSDNLSIGVNPINFKGITFKMIGSAPMNALSNVQLFIDGTSKGSASVNAMGQYVFDMNANPVKLNTGSHLVELRGDVVAGASRFFYMSVERGTDVVVEDSTLPGVNVAVSTGGTSNGSFSIKNSGTITIGAIGTNSQTVILSQDPSFSNNTTLVPGATQVTIGQWKATAYSEDVKFLSLPVTVATTSANTGGSNTLANVGVYVNGAQVGSNLASPYVLGTTANVSGLGSNLYIPAGQTVTISVKADIADTNGSAYTTGTFVATLGAASVQGISSQQTNTTSSSGGQQMSVNNSVKFGTTAGFSASTKAPNQTGVKIGSFSVQAGSAEGLTLTTIAVSIDNNFSGQLTNLTLKDGSTVLGTPYGNPSASTASNFNVNLTVPQSTTKVIDVYADLGTISSGSVTPSMAVTYRGNTSNITGYCGTGSTCSSSVLAALSQGAATTVGTVTLAGAGVTLNAGSSPVTQLVVAGQTNFNIATFNFVPTTAVAGATIKDITFTVPANTITGITVNGQNGTVIGTTATVYNVNAAVPATGGLNLPVAVSLACVGTGNGCSANSPLLTNVSVASFTYNNGSSVQTVNSGLGSAVSNNMYIVGSKPTFTVNSTQQTGLVPNAENKIGEVTVAADAAGQVKVNVVRFNVVSTNLGASSAYTVRIADGNTTIANATCTAISAGVSGTTDCTFAGGYTIAAGTSKTFSLFGTMSGGAPVASSVVSVSSSVVAANTTWTDVNGDTTATPQASTNVYNFPTASYSIRQ